jgi:apolipoprotein N-acyltransferase
MNPLLALATAVLLILAFPRFDLAWLAPVALAPLLIAVAREARAWRRFLLGWAAGVVYWFGVCYWIQFVLAFHGGLGDVAGWAVFTLFAVLKALHMGVFATLAGIAMRRWWAIPAVAALWVAVEATHGSLGFAWLALGNAGIAMEVPMRLAPFTGVWGLSFLFAAASATLALAALGRKRIELAWLAVLPLIYLLPGLPAVQRGHETALLVQPNISETEEWTAGKLETSVREQAGFTLSSALRETQQPPSIVVWPEVPEPLYYEEDPSFRGEADALARALRAYFLVGVVGHTQSGAPLNSAALVSPQGGLVSRYDKVNLVPFGEFVPWPLGFANKISTELGDFAPGNRVVVSPVGGGHKIGTFICYESVFPNFVRRFAASGAEALFNISNDGWFGKSGARMQHLEIARMRAAENRRWILRATNDGVTATIDSAGRLRGSLPPFTRATSYTGFDYESGTTFYTRHGDWFAWLCGALAVVCLGADGIERAAWAVVQRRRRLPS